MKKYLIVLAAAVVALASCNKGSEGGSEYTKLAFKETSITLAVDESAKLNQNLTWEPSSLVAPTCEWASSNTAVATVNQNGLVTAVAEGEANITAKHGDLTAVCKVTVQGAEDMIEWAGWTVWNFDEETPLCDPVDIELTIGTVKCVMYPANAFVWDTNITPVYEGKNMTGLSGLGYVLEVVNMPIYIIAEGDYKGYYVGSSYLSIVDPDQFNPNDTAFAYCAAAGKLGDAQKFYDYLTNEESTVEYSECMTGTELSIIDWDNSKGYYWFGLGGTGIYAGDESEIYYRSNVTWFAKQTGLVFEEDGETLKAPGIWGEMTDKYYEKLPQEAAKKYLKPMKVVNREKPVINRTVLPTDKKVFVRK